MDMGLDGDFSVTEWLFQRNGGCVKGKSQNKRFYGLIEHKFTAVVQSGKTIY